MALINVKCKILTSFWASVLYSELHRFLLPKTRYIPLIPSFTVTKSGKGFRLVETT